MENIPTAQEFLWGKILTPGDTEPYGHVPNDKIPFAMKEFAKLHVKAALEEANKIANNYVAPQNFGDAILNAYPLENIK